jgi:hypothetical protein
VKRYPIGSTVWVSRDKPDGPREPAVVLHHGRDSHGIYTRVRFADDEELEYHRSWIHEKKDGSK